MANEWMKNAVVFITFVLQMRIACARDIIEGKYWVDDLTGSQATSASSWYDPARSWTWKESGSAFPSSDANDNWGSTTNPFFLYVQVCVFVCKNIWTSI